jgi:hypothetical protein
MTRRTRFTVRLATFGRWYAVRTAFAFLTFSTCAGRAIGCPATWIAPPPITAPPTATALSFARAIFTDIGPSCSCSPAAPDGKFHRNGFCVSIDCADCVVHRKPDRHEFTFRDPLFAQERTTGEVNVPFRGVPIVRMPSPSVLVRPFGAAIGPLQADVRICDRQRRRPGQRWRAGWRRHSIRRNSGTGR